MRAPDGPAPPLAGGGDREGSDRLLSGGHATRNQTRKPDLVLLTELWERTSAKGTRYLRGYLAFLDKEQRDDGVIVWKLFVSPNERDDGR